MKYEVLPHSIYFSVHDKHSSFSFSLVAFTSGYRKHTSCDKYKTTTLQLFYSQLPIPFNLSKIIVEPVWRKHKRSQERVLKLDGDEYSILCACCVPPPPPSRAQNTHRGRGSGALCPPTPVGGVISLPLMETNVSAQREQINIPQ